MKNFNELKKNLKSVKLEDYKLFDYEIPEIFLDFVIEEDRVTVKTKLKLIKINKISKNLFLDGKDIFIDLLC